MYCLLHAPCTGCMRKSGCRKYLSMSEWSIHSKGIKSCSSRCNGADYPLPHDGIPSQNSQRSTLYGFPEGVQRKSDPVEDAFQRWQSHAGIRVHLVQARSSSSRPFVEFEHILVMTYKDYSSLASLDFLASTLLRTRESNFISLALMNLAQDRGNVENGANTNIFQPLFQWAKLAYKSPSARPLRLIMPG